ncbi:Zn-dependent oxidoreductase NADPH:quinone reductase [Pseudorhizobium endolithicum]|uniref:Zn-dependent oxidoreductase NADPH:quinone reductase n=1 Tax=Pseudorhizobium endolithicum TaxID=1191678 RepID=A0ABM8PT19_9HYPH|nr:hypothetical protein [Pseudorhizobium endolithicum]CAD7046783.1 Zn-dependent oxidoreductase NADPH:quinone reductase [Pseudorhizobium endolithicum]
MSIYYRYSDANALEGTIVVSLYRSGDEIRAFIEEVAEPQTGETIFPAEEMEPEAAFRIAENKNRDPSRPVLVELKEGITWNDAWGELR